MSSIRERANVFLYQSATCTNCRQLFNCFEIARFVRTFEDNYKLSGHRHKVVSLYRMLFDFVPASSNTSGEAKIYRFIFAIKGLLVFLGHFDPYCNSRILHFHYVDARHELVFCAGLKLKHPSLIATLFPLQVSYSSCLYSFCVR